MSKLHQISAYLGHLFSAKTRFYIHSPFVFDFINQVKRNSNNYYAFNEIYSIRKAYLNSSETIKVDDFGAGSQHTSSTIRKISDIARLAGTDQKKGSILFNLVNHYQPMNILELGTSLGLGTLYMSKANNDSTLHTIEGSPEVARFAQQSFQDEGAENIVSHIGEFEVHLDKVLKKLKQVDLAFIDGHHTEEATLKYFDEILPFTTDKSILVFDDIYWSKGMTNAWNKIITHPDVTVSIDLYRIGICFFHSTQVKENFKLYF